MSSLYLMSKLCDVQRETSTGAEDPFGQTESGGPEIVSGEDGRSCEVWNTQADIEVNGRRVVAQALWYGIMDARAAVRTGDTLVNFRDKGGEQIYPDDEYPAEQGGNRPFELRVLRAALEPGRHVGLTLEDIGGVTNG